LLLDIGHTWAAICDKLDCTDSFIDRWSKRFLAQRLARFFSRHAGQLPTTLTPAVEARILEWSVKRKPVDSTHGSTRKLGAQLGISHMMVARVRRKHALRPHRLEDHKASNDPEFETKAAEIIGLYLHPPQHAAVFCVKTAIQALDRKDPALPLSPGRAERHGFEYYRHGTLSLYAAFNTKTGDVLGKTAARHTSAEFVAFLADIVANQTARERGPPTYYSWLNQVELWFSKIERDVVAREVFTWSPTSRENLCATFVTTTRLPRP
jgi:hypothetical protein